MRTAPRIAGITTVIAIAVALVAPAGAAAAAPAQITGEVYSGPLGWIDKTLDDTMTVGVPYSSSIQANSNDGPYLDEDHSGLPDGLSLSLDHQTGVLTVSGTPTTAYANFSFSVYFQGSNGENSYELYFSGVNVLAATDPTTTTVSAVPYQDYASVQLDAEIVPTGSTIPTGTVTFKFGTTTIGTGTVSTFGTKGIATFSGAVASSYIGTTQSVTAVYSGDEENGASTSPAVNVYIYGDRVVSGYFVRNGAGTAGEQIRLLSPTAVPTSYTDVTGPGGLL